MLCIYFFVLRFSFIKRILRSSRGILLEIRVNAAIKCVIDKVSSRGRRLFVSALLALLSKLLVCTWRFSIIYESHALRRNYIEFNSWKHFFFVFFSFLHIACMHACMVDRGNLLLGHSVPVPHFSPNSVGFELNFITQRRALQWKN